MQFWSDFKEFLIRFFDIRRLLIIRNLVKLNRQNLMFFNFFIWLFTKTLISTWLLSFFLVFPEFSWSCGNPELNFKLNLDPKMWKTWKKFLKKMTTLLVLYTCNFHIIAHVDFFLMLDLQYTLCSLNLEKLQKIV